MDALIVALRDLSQDLIPILGAICLICVIILLIKMIKVFSSLDVTLVKTHGTIDLANQSIEKVQAPLDTVAKVSKTVDRAHDATVKAVEDTKDFIVRNVGEAKDTVTSVGKGKEEKPEKFDELKEPDPEDVIGG